MSYKMTMTQCLSDWRAVGDARPNCAISGKRISIGNQVMDVNRETMQLYGRFLSEQNHIKSLVGTPLIANIMSYLINSNSKLMLSQFGEVTQTTRSGRITKKPLRLSDAKFIPGGSKALVVDQYDRGYDRGSHYDTEQYANDFKRDPDGVYNEGDIVDDDEEIERYSSSEDEEEWESGESSDENSESDWCSSGEDEEDDGSEPEYDVFEDGR
jgi:hypothetical protein